MSKLLFTHSYYLRRDPKQWRARNAYPPLATLFAAGYLRSFGFDVGLFDSMLARGPEEFEATLKAEQPKYVVIYEDGFNYLSKMCLMTMREASFEMIRAGRSADCIVIVSSSDATDHRDEYLDAGANYIIVGEAEQTLLELVTDLERHTDTSLAEATRHIPGLVYRENGCLIETPKREVLRNLDIVGLPAWDLVKMDDYRKFAHGGVDHFSLNMVTTRGCPFSCNWCAKPIYGSRYNSRSPAHVVAEMEMLVKEYNVRHLWFTDDIFGLKPGWVQEFASLIESSGIKIEFKIQSRVDLLLESETIEALVRAGCSEIWVGAESGSQKILDAMDKGTRVEQIYRARKALRKAGIATGFFLQFGYPGERKEDIDATFRMVHELMPDAIGVSVSYPLPGTVFHDNVKSLLQIKQNWNNSDDLDTLYHTDHRTGYYKTLQRSLHHQFRVWQFEDRLKAQLVGNKPLVHNVSLGYSALRALHGAIRLRFERAELARADRIE